MHGLAISIALYGTVVGAAFGGYFADAWDVEKFCFGLDCFFFCFCKLGSALAQDVIHFHGVRLIGGFSIGASSVIAPLYILEIAPLKKGLAGGIVPVQYCVWYFGSLCV